MWNKVLEIINETLKDQVLKDSLIGLYNNGYIFDYLDQAIEKGRHSEKDLSWLMTYNQSTIPMGI